MLALVLLADKLGVGSEMEALNQVLEIRPDAIPNNYFVQIGDTLLKRNGALRSCLNDLYNGILRTWIKLD